MKDSLKDKRSGGRRQAVQFAATGKLSPNSRAKHRQSSKGSQKRRKGMRCRRRTAQRRPPPPLITIEVVLIPDRKGEFLRGRSAPL